ncbi:unnamed protein product [Moneuplotes crassus]|uniref:Uncharacterized protein n=1 Tax=Euplotes crassus TaxID=5936 RepID=A0AAD1XEA2_EUPCR|nr:unnamed protein product [Moneuplotes crassus]
MKIERRVTRRTDPRFDRAKGCIVGALCGDAAGAVLEFYKGKITKALCRKAIRMPGGGTFNVGPGQVTDDGELTMSLLHALVNGEGQFKETEVAKYYGKWYRSNPFDCGITIGNALSVANPKRPNPDDIKDEAERRSQGSQSNGSLMRATPLAVFCHNMKAASAEGFDAEEWNQHKACVFEAADLDASFTHPSPAVHYVEGLYIYMMTLIINGVKLADVYNTIIAEIYQCDKEEYKDLILEWVEKSDEEELGSLEHQMGWMKHAFVCCLRYLRLAKEQQKVAKKVEEEVSEKFKGESKEEDSQLSKEEADIKAKKKAKKRAKRKVEREARKEVKRETEREFKRKATKETKKKSKDLLVSHSTKMQW